MSDNRGEQARGDEKPNKKPTRQQHTNTQTHTHIHRDRDRDRDRRKHTDTDASTDTKKKKDKKKLVLNPPKITDRPRDSERAQ
jgi:hypothetical protein